MNGSGSLERIKKYIPQIKTAISTLGYEVTPGDVSVKTGLPILETEHVLKDLVSDYYGEIKVSNKGDLVYFFPTKFRKNRYSIGKKIKERAKSFLKVLYKGFQAVYKASIMVILVLYFVILIVLYIAILMAGSKGSGSRGRRGGFNIFFWMWASGTGKNNRYNKYKDNSNDGKPKKAFYKRVFEFVFGGDDPNNFLYKHLDKIVARFIHDKNGAIIPQEITPVTAVSFKNANIEVAKYVGKFESQPEVTNKGTIILTFPRLLTSAAKRIIGDSKFATKNKAYYELPIKHNENESKHNVIICALNTVNLFLSGGIYFMGGGLVNALTSPKAAATIKWVSNLLSHPVGYFALGIFPFFFSILFFLIPAIRMSYVKSHNRKVRKRNLYKAVALAVMDKGSIIYPDSLILPREADMYIDSYNDRDIDAVLHDMALSSACKVEYDKESKKYYDFSELMTNLKDVRRYRKENIIGEKISENEIDFRTDKDLFNF